MKERKQEYRLKPIECSLNLLWRIKIIKTSKNQWSGNIWGCLQNFINCLRIQFSLLDEIVHRLRSHLLTYTIDHGLLASLLHFALYPNYLHWNILNIQTDDILHIGYVRVNRTHLPISSIFSIKRHYVYNNSVSSMVLQKKNFDGNLQGNRRGGHWFPPGEWSPLSSTTTHLGTRAWVAVTRVIFAQLCTGYCNRLNSYYPELTPTYQTYVLNVKSPRLTPTTFLRFPWN